MGHNMRILEYWESTFGTEILGIQPMGRKNYYEQRISELKEQLENAKLENLILKKLQPQSKPSQTEKKLK